MHFISTLRRKANSSKASSWSMGRPHHPFTFQTWRLYNQLVSFDSVASESIPRASDPIIDQKSCCSFLLPSFSSSIVACRLAILGSDRRKLHFPTLFTSPLLCEKSCFRGWRSRNQSFDQHAFLDCGTVAARTTTMAGGTISLLFQIAAFWGCPISATTRRNVP